MISCKKATLLLTIREDRSLTTSERLGLSLHLGVCSLCRNYLQQTKLITELFRKSELVKLEAEVGKIRLSNETITAIKNSIKSK